MFDILSILGGLRQRSLPLVAPLRSEDMPTEVIPVVLAGRSAQHRAFDFLGYSGTRTSFAPPIIFCDHQERFQMAEEARRRDITPLAIAVRPNAYDICLPVAAVMVAGRQSNTILALMPSDPGLGISRPCETTMKEAIKLADRGKFVLIGLEPTRTSINDVSIQGGEELVGCGEAEVEKMVRVPDAWMAGVSLAGGAHCGVFVAKAQALLDECSRVSPVTIENAHQSLDNAKQGADFLRLGPKTLPDDPAGATLVRASSCAVLHVGTLWQLPTPEKPVPTACDAIIRVLLDVRSGKHVPGIDYADGRFSCTQRDLANACGFCKSTISAALHSMDKSGKLVVSILPRKTIIKF
jgi:mannose-1-phosphate guanylyltransferase